MGGPKDSVPAHGGRLTVITRTTISDENDGERLPDSEGGLHLLIMSPDSFTTLPLPKQGVLTIGRSPGPDTQMGAPLASREPGQLPRGDQFFTQDRGSKN